jgi:hypothetical protein
MPIKTEISVELMEAAANLYRKARGVINVTNADNYGQKIDDLQIAVYLYEESIQSEIVRLHNEL